MTLLIFQVLMKKIFECVEENDFDTLSNLAQGKLALSQNKCGHTILHKALLQGDKLLICDVIETFCHLVNWTDNVSSQI